MPRASKTGVKGLYKADGRYHIDLRYDDVRTGAPKRYVEHLARGIPLAAAKERALQRLNDAYAGRLGEAVTASRMLYACFEDYLAWSKQNRPRTYRDRAHLIRMLKRHIGDVPVENINQLTVERFKRERGKENIKPATINRAVAMWKHFVGRTLTEGWIDEQTAKSARSVTMLKEPPGRVRYLTAEETHSLLAALRPDVRDVVVTALLTGMRRGEILNLRKVSVDLGARLIRLTETKTNKARFIPIHDELVEVLRAASEHSPSEFVFVGREGRPLTHRIAAVFRRTVTQLGIRDLRFHDLRHDFATKLRRAGMGLDVISTLLGHTTLAMTQRYAHLGREELRAAVAALPGTRGLPPISTPSGEARSK